MVEANPKIGVRFELHGPVGAEAVIEGSSNLTAWVPRLTNGLPNGALGFIEAPAISAAGRGYFRARVTPAPPKISVTLETTPLNVGLGLRAVDGESRAEPTNHLGTVGWRPVLGLPGNANAWYMYYLVSDTRFTSGNMPGVKIEITFFDEGVGTLGLAYDSSDPTFRVNPTAPAGVWKSAGRITLTGSRTWRTESLVIGDALFTKRCNGADFRFEIAASASPTIHSVVIRRYTSPTVHWRLIPTTLPSSDPVIAGLTVQDFGAVGDGSADDTAAFRDALAAMKAAGGGTVFAPAGRYDIRTPLTIPTGVTLRGEWERPGAQPLRGTVLQATHDRGNAAGSPFLQLEACAALVDLAIWHPEQTASAPVPYPPAIKMLGGMSAAVRNLTLVNPWRGLVIGPENNELHLVRGLFGTPLDLGLSLDFTTDIGRLEDIEFSPQVWERSGLPGAPAPGGPHTAFLRSNAVGLRCYRSDWEYGSFIRISGYHVGMEFLAGPNGPGNGQFYGVEVSQCDTGISMVQSTETGYLFTASRLAAFGAPLRTDPAFAGALEFHDTQFQGPIDAAVLDGTSSSVTLFDSCSFTGTVRRQGGYLSLLGNQFTAPGQHLVLGSAIEAVTAVGNSFLEPRRITDDSGLDGLRLMESDRRVTTIPGVNRPPDWPGTSAPRRLFVVTDPPYLASRSGTNDATLAIARALQAASDAGGGIVFVPPGNYALQGNLVVPSDVELRGAFETPHHTVGRGSVLRVLGGRGNGSAEPTVILSPRSSLRGMTFLHPEQRFGSLVPYPYLIQGRGSDVSIINVTAVNPWRFIDLATYRCDRHHVDYAAGAPLLEGVRAGGGSVDGLVRDVQFNPHYWARSPFTDNPLASIDDLWAYLGTHLDPFVFGDWTGMQHGNFVFGSATGLRLIAENGRGPSGVALGHGTDGSPVAVTAEATHPAGFSLINAQLVSMQFSNRAYLRISSGANLKLYNATFWGSPGLSVDQSGGSLELELANFSQFGPLQLHGGSTYLANTYLGRRRGAGEDIDLGGGSLSARGVLSGVGLRISGPGASLLGNASRDPAPVSGAPFISAILSQRPARDGLALREGDGESANLPTTVGGRVGWCGARTIAPGINAYYMYFDVTHPEFVEGGSPGGQITVEYYDAGSGGLRLVYDSSDPTVHVVASAPGAWKQAGTLSLTGSRTWKTWSVRVPDALFAGRCNGADFRVEINAVNPAVIGMFGFRRP